MCQCVRLLFSKWNRPIEFTQKPNTSYFNFYDTAKHFYVRVCLFVCHEINGLTNIMLHFSSSLHFYPLLCVCFLPLPSYGMVRLCARATDRVCVALCMCPSTSSLCACLPACLPACLGRGNHYAYYAYRHHEGKKKSTTPPLCLLQWLMGDFGGSYSDPPKL